MDFSFYFETPSTGRDVIGDIKFIRMIGDCHLGFIISIPGCFINPDPSSINCIGGKIFLAKDSNVNSLSGDNVCWLNFVPVLVIKFNVGTFTGIAWRRRVGGDRSRGRRFRSWG